MTFFAVPGHTRPLPPLPAEKLIRKSLWSHVYWSASRAWLPYPLHSEKEPLVRCPPWERTSSYIETRVEGGNSDPLAQ